MSAGFVLVEGVYTSYAYYDGQDMPCWYYAVINCQETTILLVDNIGQNIYVYDIAAKTLTLIRTSDNLIAYGYEGYRDASVFGTYSIIKEEIGAAVNLLVYKNGVLLQVIAISDIDLSTIQGAVISQRAQYIIVFGRRISTGNYGFIVLKGS